MSKIINLRRARKQKSREQKRAIASVQAAKHGRTKPERLRDSTLIAKAQAHVDSHKREHPE